MPVQMPPYLSHLHSTSHIDSLSKEISAYVNSGIKTMVDVEGNPFRWWSKREKTIKYPSLSAMARDYLPVPATSTPCERVFSCGRHLVSFERHSLSPNMIESLLCLNNWNRNGFIECMDILEDNTEDK